MNNRNYEPLCYSAFTFPLSLHIFYVPNDLLTKMQKLQIFLSGSVTVPVEQPVCHLVPVLHEASLLVIVLWCSSSAQSTVGS